MQHDFYPLENILWRIALLHNWMWQWPDTLHSQQEFYIHDIHIHYFYLIFNISNGFFHTSFVFDLISVTSMRKFGCFIYRIWTKFNFFEYPDSYPYLVNKLIMKELFNITCLCLSCRKFFMKWTYKNIFIMWNVFVFLHLTFMFCDD